MTKARIFLSYIFLSSGPTGRMDDQGREIYPIATDNQLNEESNMDWEKLFGPIKDVFPFIKRHDLAIVSFIALFSWSVILLPTGLFAFLGLDKYRADHFGKVGLAAFVTLLYICFRALHHLYSCLKSQREKRVNEYSLQKLTPKEYSYLWIYVESKTQTATFSIYDGVVYGLTDKRILYKANSQANIAGEQDFNIYPWAYEYLMSHQDIFQKKQ